MKQLLVVLYVDYKHIRLFALCVPEGWQAALYNLSTHNWIDKGGSFVFVSPDEAKADATQKAEMILHEELSDLDWR